MPSMEAPEHSHRNRSVVLSLVMEDSRFSFVSDRQYRAVLEKDYAEVVKCVEAGAVKAAATLAGSIVEALLTDYLLDKNHTKVRIKGKNVEIERAGLSALNEFCRSSRFITERVYHLIEVIRDYRNLIHPARATRSSATVSDDDARLHQDTLNIVIETIGAKRQNEFGATADQLMAFVLDEPNSTTLFPAMVEKAREDDRRDFMLVNAMAKLRELHSTLSGELSDNDDYVQYAENRIQKVYRTFHICFEKSDLESRKAVAREFLQRTMHATLAERHYLPNLFEPPMIDHVDQEHHPLILSYVAMNVKTMDFVGLDQIVPEFGRFVNKSNVLHVVSGMISQIRQDPSLQLADITAQFLKKVKDRHPDRYEESIDRLRDRPASRKLAEDEAIQRIFTVLGESFTPPSEFEDDVPF